MTFQAIAMTVAIIMCAIGVVATIAFTIDAIGKYQDRKRERHVCDWYVYEVCEYREWANVWYECRDKRCSEHKYDTVSMKKKDRYPQRDEDLL